MYRLRRSHGSKPFRPSLRASHCHFVVASVRLGQPTTKLELLYREVIGRRSAITCSRLGIQCLGSGDGRLVGSEHCGESVEKGTTSPIDAQHAAKAHRAVQECRKRQEGSFSSWYWRTEGKHHVKTSLLCFPIRHNKFETPPI